MNAIELGIRTHCLGGHSVDGGMALSGTETYRALSEISVDLLFFSSQSLSEDGIISDSTEDENFVRKLMLKSAKKTVFLCDDSKFGNRSTYQLCNLNDVDHAVFNIPFENLSNKGESV